MNYLDVKIFIKILIVLMVMVSLYGKNVYADSTAEYGEIYLDSFDSKECSSEKGVRLKAIEGKDGNEISFSEFPIKVKPGVYSLYYRSVKKLSTSDNLACAWSSSNVSICISGKCKSKQTKYKGFSKKTVTVERGKRYKLSYEGFTEFK